MIRTQFGEAVRERRRKMRMSQHDLANSTEMHPGYIARIESDGAVPGTEKIHRLAQVLEIPEEKLHELASLTKGNMDILSDYPNLQEIFQRAFFSMTDEEIRDTLQLIELRIGLYHEDKDALAHNLKEFLLGRLSLEERPRNGLRPLIHYIASWSGEIEKWMSKI